MKKLLEIFQEINILMILIDKAVVFYRKQNHYKALLITGEISQKLNNLIPKLFDNKPFLNSDYTVVDNDYIIQMLNEIVKAQANSDYVLIGDLYEEQLAPFLSAVQSVVRESGIDIPNGYWEDNIAILESENIELCKLILKDKDLNKRKYCVEYTSVGTRTVKITTDTNKFYLHSNGNPFKEADIFATEYIEKGVKEYIVYGFGFGYHIRTLLESSINVNITVYESDLHILSLACEYCNIQDILSSKRVKIIYDHNFEMFRKGIKKKDTSFVIHYPSVMNIANKAIRERLEEYFLFYSSSKNQEEFLYRNFQNNIKKKTSYIDELESELKNKKLIVVAGGPSLDNEIEYLRELSESYKILAVGRVIKKLLAAEINPDYLIMVDANPSMLKQIKGLNLKNIPLLYSSTLYYQVLEEYVGKKYLILQEGYAMAEEYAYTLGVKPCNTGGSVSTTAIEVGIRLGCSTIICIGLDLAFVNNQTHASNTGGNTIIETDNLREVASVDGTTLYTSKSLDSFRHWIERRISKETNINFINASKGANIQGMKNKCLKDIIREIE